MTRWKWRLWAWPRDLAQCGALGINRRNGDYVLMANPRACYPRVDDKLRTKRICEAHGIPVPETYAAIERYGDVRKFPELLAGRQQFVIKPGRGSEGRGIVVVADHDGTELVTAGGQRLSLADVRYHVATILSGLYSLGGQPDSAIVEQRIVPHPAFERIAVGGTPDVRIVLYRGVPAMAMVRLPTRASRGRANLHQGAIAAGIHLRRGITLGGVLCNRAVSVHPDTGATIEGLEIPFWNRLLAAAMELADAVKLGYLGVDFVLDAGIGPVVLEANARPGLAIQVANRCGLRRRLQWIDAQNEAERAPDRRFELVKHLADLDGASEPPRGDAAF
jgi:alpha-L-glutamate ligase-like protein